MKDLIERLRLHADNKTKQAMQRDGVEAAAALESQEAMLRTVRENEESLIRELAEARAELAQTRAAMADQWGGLSTDRGQAQILYRAQVVRSGGPE